MADHASLIFFRLGRGNLNVAAAALADRGLTVRRKGRGSDAELVVGFRAGPRLRVAFVEEPYVRDEAEELAAGSCHATEMAGCEARYEILIDDLDGALDEMNTLIDVQAALQDATDGYLFNTWNGELQAPEKKNAELADGPDRGRIKASPRSRPRRRRGR
jgi:hypothetical protein